MDKSVGAGLNNTAFELLTTRNLNQRVKDICDIIKKYPRKKIRYSDNYVYNVPIAFDTETTSLDCKIAFLYISMIRIGSPNNPNSISLYWRDSDLLDALLNGISKGLNLVENKTILYVYVHNLGFDIEFIRDKLNIVRQLHANTHEPVSVLDNRNIEFRDSLILANKSLFKIGKDDLNGVFSKKVGDLDYTKIRTPDTTLSDIELGYCQGDIDVLTAYIQKEIDEYNGIQNIPLTNTGRVRKYCRDRINHNKSYGMFSRYRALMNECVLTPDEYNQCNKAYYGGFTHANAKYTGKTLSNVISHDFTSSYPYVMLSERYPIGKPTHYDSMSFDEIKKICNDITKCAIFDIQISNVAIKHNIGDCFISGDAQKTVMINPVLDNGRVRYCEKLALTLTDVDFKIINRVYEYDKIVFKNILVWDADFLPTLLIDIVKDLYKNKTSLKGIAGKELDYNNSKSMLNSLYGMCVTRILRDIIEIQNGEWIKTKLTDEQKIENITKNNNSKTRFLYYPWGVFISAYARANLWTAISNLGDDYIYSDTDSIKTFDTDNVRRYVELYQQDVKFKLTQMLNIRRKFTYDDFSPKTIKGDAKPIGIWDYEGKYDFFKTLGSKRYIRYNVKDGLKSTVAGINPTKLSLYLLFKSGNIDDYMLLDKNTFTDKLNELNNDNIVIQKAFSMFKDGLHIPAKFTGKLGSTYCKNIELGIIDYQGHKSVIKQKYAVSLNPVDFTLTMNGTYLDLIRTLQDSITG